MPGYDVSRFVNLRKSEEELVICLICHDVLKNPVVVRCCLQTYCNDCIRIWLKTNSVCPNDRKLLTESQLTNVPRMVVNLLGKLKIKCDYESHGCTEIVDLETLQ